MSRLPLLMNMNMNMSRLTNNYPLFTLLKSLPALTISLPNPSSHQNINHHSTFTTFKISSHNCNFTTLALSSSSSSSSSSTQSHYNSQSMPKSATKRARHALPEFVLKGKLDMCSKHNNLVEAIQLYREARRDGTPLNINHFNSLLYLCSLNAAQKVDDFDGIDGLEMGFEIFRQMGIENVAPNEATFTSLARLAAAKEDPEMAFELVKQMMESNIEPKLRSYGPALFGFCENGDAERAYEVDAHMVETGVVAEEGELAALFKVSAEAKRGDKVYEMLHRLRTSVRQVSEETVGIIESWFLSETGSDVGLKSWDVQRVKKSVAKGGGGWHGQGWLGEGKWKVFKSEMDENGVCHCCGERLVCIDIDPKETEGFARSLSSLASQREKEANFVQFQEWLKRHGPFDAVVDGANVGLTNTHKFSFRQLSDVVNQLRQLSPTKKMPLVILHRGRVCRGPAENPNAKRILDDWRKCGALYSTPHGSNDDWYWLYAAVSNKCLLVTNDEMRDHLFQLLGNSIFPRWKEKHQVRMTVSRKGLALHMPPPYSVVIQESEGGSWHIPTVTGDDLQTPRQWLCATRVSRTFSRASPRLSNLF